MPLDQASRQFPNVMQLTVWHNILCSVLLWHGREGESRMRVYEGVSLARQFVCIYSSTAAFP